MTWLVPIGLLLLVWLGVYVALLRERRRRR